MFREIKGYELKALQFAEKHGVIEYVVKGNKMIFYTSYEAEMRTYKSVVNLDTMKEDVEVMKRYYTPFKYIGKCQVNYGG